MVECAEQSSKKERYYGRQAGAEFKESKERDGGNQCQHSGGHQDKNKTTGHT